MNFRLHDRALVGSLTPAGGGGAITPATYGNLVAHWKADSLALADGTPVGAGGGSDWLDETVNNFDLSQGTSGARPQFKTAIFGSLPAIRFDGTDDFLNFASTLALSAAADPYTIIFVGAVTSAADSMILGHSGNIQIRINRSGANIISNYLGVTDILSSTFANASNVVRMMTWRRTGTAISHRENKTNVTSGSPNDGSNFSLSRMGTTAGFGWLNGDVAEVIVYQAYRSDAEMDALYDDYLKPRWGLP